MTGGAVASSWRSWNRRSRPNLAVVLALLVAVIAATLALSAPAASADVPIKCAPTLPLSTGGSHSLSVAPSGALYAWGSNYFGTLGDGTTTDRKSPVLVSGIGGVVAVAAGGGHSLAVTEEGEVWAWGWNYSGEVGDGTTTMRTVPTKVLGLPKIAAVAAGNYHSMALASDGTVWAWGYNYYGQLGRGDNADSAVAVQVPNLSGVLSIAAGSYHSLAVKADGTVWAWGYGMQGELGDGAAVNRWVPTKVSVSGVFTSADGGNDHSLFLRNDGAVFGTGENYDGQLGDLTYTRRLLPVQANISSVEGLDAGGPTSMARKTDGTVWAWGNNYRGFYGNGTSGYLSNSPVQGSATGAKVITAGGMTAGMVTSSGAVRMWGANDLGQVGDGSLTDRSSPVTLGISQSTPGTPTDLDATAGEGIVYLTWSPPATGSKTILQYVITPYVDGVAQTSLQVGTGSTATSYTMSGLSTGATYTFTVAAQNCIGNGAASAQSGRVIPTGIQVNDEGFKVEGTRITDRLGLHVNTFNGNLSITASDVGIKGTGLDLAIARTYNNRTGSTSIFGNGWSSNVGSDVKLEPLMSGSQMLHAGAGTQVGFAQDADGSYITPPGVAATLVRSADSSFVLSYHQTGLRWRFNSSGALTSMVDRNGNSISYAYGGPGGLVSSVTDTQGRVTLFAYNASNLVSTVTDPAGRVHQYGYDAAKNLTTYADPGGGLTTFDYDGNKNLTKLTTPAGREVAFAYDATKRVTSMSRPLMAGNPATRFAYNSGNTVVTDARSNNTTYTFDPVGRTTGVTDANGVATSLSYTSSSNVGQYQTGNGSTTTTFGYDNVNNLNHLLAQSGAYSELDYDDANNPYSPTGVTDPQNNTTTLAYDSKGNLLTATNQLASQNQVQLTYNADGTVSTSSDARSQTTAYGYDSRGNMASVTPPAPLGDTTVGYDSISRMTSLTDGKNQTTTYAYDALDRLLITTHSDGTSVVRAYDADGNLTSLTDAGGVTTMSYDGAGRLTQRTTPGPTTTVTYGYDAVGNLAALTDPGGTTTYAYNAVNLTTAVTDPANKVISLGYDARYNRTSVAYPNGVTRYSTYDDANRLVNTNAVRSSTTLTNSNYTYKPSDPTRGSANPITMRGSPTLSNGRGTKVSTVTIPKPEGIVAGDLLVAQIATMTYISTAPAGWTLIREDKSGDGFSDVRQGIYWKIAGSSEPPSYTWIPGGTISYEAVGGITAWTGVDTGSPIAGSSGAVDGTAAYYGTAVVADGPRGYWRFGEPAGATAAANFAYPYYDGNYWGDPLLGQPDALTGDPDTAVATGGASARYMGTSVVQSGYAYSVEAWVKSTDTGLQRVIVQNRGTSSTAKSLTLSMGGTYPGGPGVAGDLALGVDSAAGYVGVYTPAAYNDGQWHHVVGTWSAPSGGTILSTQFNLYVDGAEVTTLPSTSGALLSAPLAGSGGTTIGRHAAWNTHFTGSVDEVALYDRALGADRIAAHYQAGRTAPTVSAWNAPSVSYLNRETNLAFYAGRLFGPTGPLSPPDGYVELYDTETARTTIALDAKVVGRDAGSAGDKPITGPNARWVGQQILLRPTYDSALRQTTPAGSVTYDALNRVTAAGGGYTYTYDGASNRLSQSKGAERVDYTPNAANQLASLKRTISLVGTATGKQANGSSLNIPLPAATSPTTRSSSRSPEQGATPRRCRATPRSPTSSRARTPRSPSSAPAAARARRWRPRSPCPFPPASNRTTRYWWR